MMRMLFIAAAAAALAGCATSRPPEIVTRIETREVQIPVPVQCPWYEVEKVRPATGFAYDAFDPARCIAAGGNAESCGARGADALLVDRRQRQSYIAKLEGAVNRCSARP